MLLPVTRQPNRHAQLTLVNSAFSSKGHILAGEEQGPGRCVLYAHGPAFDARHHIPPDPTTQQPCQTPATLHAELEHPNIQPSGLSTVERGPWVPLNTAWRTPAPKYEKRKFFSL